MTELELLAPARNADIGIAAIACGADAVYIAGPEFGARQAAGNPIDQIERLCTYAHRFGARIFVTLNTILLDDEELKAAYRLMLDVQEAGADAIIVQDLAVLKLAHGLDGGPQITIPLHASTQCAIRTPEKAEFYASLGYGRLILERELSLDQIRAIRQSVDTELEFFVHGALCVCYSGNCYLSENIAGRSANRGSCIQACRSRYDLVDSRGKVIVRNKALLSLKDYNLKERLADLAQAGITSFKIEGRLKNISYVRNVVREYSLALDKLVHDNPDRYRRASFGKVTKGFRPDVDKTFNRGYTSLFIDGKRGQWSSMDAPKGMGEEIGTVESVKTVGADSMEIRIRPYSSSLRLSNGDGFSVAGTDDISGFRGEVCEGNVIRTRRTDGIKTGSVIWRNLCVAFEKEMDSNPCVREMAVAVDIVIGEDFTLSATATSEDGRTVHVNAQADEPARDAERMKETVRSQISKKAGIYSFSLRSLECDGGLPFMTASQLNGIRRNLADLLDAQPCLRRPLSKGAVSDKDVPVEEISYKANVANTLAAQLLEERGATKVDDAYELARQKDAELMRTRYCIRYELGMCPKYNHCGDSGPLFLLNNGRRLALGFDCKACEMTVKNVD